MTHEEYYGPTLEILRYAEKQLRDMMELFPKHLPEDLKPIVYYCSRIKSPESMIHKMGCLELQQIAGPHWKTPLMR